MDKMPVWFLAHGAPLQLIGEQPVRRFWQQLAERLPVQPRAILCLSAHWLSDTPSLSGMAPNPGIQYDFYGFADALYQIKWPLKDDPNTDAWLQGLLTEQLTTLNPEADHALDHGVWIPLSTAWPEPDFPVYQLSLCPNMGPRWHVELGESLSALREQGVLIIASGGIVHNLQRLQWHSETGSATAWAVEFIDAVENALQQQDIDALCNPHQFPNGSDAVPTIEHYLPLLVMLGCAGSDQITPLYQGWEYGNLSMHSYGTEP